MNRNYIDYYFDLVTNFLTFITYLKYCNYYLQISGTRFKYIRNFTIYIMFLLAVSAITIPYFWILMIIVSFIFNKYTYHASNKKDIYHVLRFNLYYYLLFIIIHILGVFIFDSAFSLRNEFYQNLKAVIICTFIYILFSILFSYKKSKIKQVINPYKKFVYLLLTLTLIILCSFVFVSVNLETNKETFQNIIIITFMVNIMMIVLIISIYEKIVGFLQESALEQLKIQKYEMNQDFYDELSEKAKQLSSLRHDFKNHLIIMRGRLVKKEYSELSDYLGSIVSYVDDASDVILTNNPTISSMLQAKKSVCKKLDIRFEYELEFNKIHKITDMDLIIILGNILDNAIDAVSKMYDNNKFINLTIKQVNTYLLIKCQNPYYEKPIEKNGQLLTTKSDTSLHGIGLMNVMDSCEKYNGECKYTYGDNEFHIEILVPNY